MSGLFLELNFSFKSGSESFVKKNRKTFVGRKRKKRENELLIEFPVFVKILFCINVRWPWMVFPDCKFEL